MQRDAAGIATLIPIMIRTANNSSLSKSTTSPDLKLTDITPSRSPVDRVAVPNNRVYEEVEAGDACPGHVETCARVPCFQVPRERYADEHKSKERKDRKNVVGVMAHS